MRTVKTLIRLGGCLGAQSLCWFCHEVAHLQIPTKTDIDREKREKASEEKKAAKLKRQAAVKKEKRKRLAKRKKLVKTHSWLLIMK